MENKILFLDYDGVLFDTLREVYIVNRYLYLNKDFACPIDEENYELYSKYKYLIYNIWMFYYYNPLVFNSQNPDKIEELFTLALNKRDKFKEEKYCREFLDIRSKLIKENYDFWKNLEKPYEFFKNIKKLYEEKNINLVIVSKKNKDSILERFEANDFKLDEKYVFAREILDRYMSKADFMAEYMINNGFKQAIFVDDNYNNLLPCKRYPAIQTILALWGNSGNKYAGMNLEEAFKKIFEFFTK